MNLKMFRPTKSDIRQIESLTKLGCNYADIASVLGITSDKLLSWEKKHTAIADLLKEKPLPEYTLSHPDFAPQVEEAFTCGGKRFYRFKEEYRMPAGRYKCYYAAIREMHLHASLETLKKYVTAFKNILNGANPKKGIELGDLWKLVWNLETIIDLGFDPQLVKNLAAVAYFDETEDLTTYDQKYGDQKLKLWEEHGLRDFFLTSPIGELSGLKGLSTESLEGFLTQMEETKTELDSVLRTVLKDNSSESGKKTSST